MNKDKDTEDSKFSYILEQLNKKEGASRGASPDIEFKNIFNSINYISNSKSDKYNAPV
jgi:hypothetical protein